MIKDFKGILEQAKKRGPLKVSVAVAEDLHVLEAIWDAKKLGIVEAYLIGDKVKINRLANEIDMDLSQFVVIDKTDPVEAAREAVCLVSSGKAQVLMKGLVDTSTIMKAVLDKEIGLRGDSILSHVAIFEEKGYKQLFYVTDAAMNIAPTLEEKAKIIENCVEVAHALDNELPKVGIICAVEKVNKKMEATIHAQKLVDMNEKGEIRNCIIGGPFALDNAISKEAAMIKNINHSVAGNAEILMVPDIEAGNVLYKSLSFFAMAKNAGIMVGAKAPIILTSRSDSREAKLHSIALGVMIAYNKNFK